MGMQGDKYMIAGYPFEGAGSDVMDSYPLSEVNISYVDGLFGQAARCNGTNGYLTRSGNIKSEFGTAVSISFWIKPKSYSKLGSIIGSSSSNKGITIRYAADPSKLETYIGNGSVYKFLGQTTTHGITTNQWNHLVVTFDGSSLKTYVNCALLSTLTAPAFTPDWGTSVNFNVGANSTGGFLTEQDIDSIKIRNKALTQAEIQRDYLNLPIF